MINYHYNDSNEGQDRLSLRSLNQALRVNNIDKAQAGTIYKLSRVLECSIEDPWRTLSHKEQKIKHLIVLYYIF